MRSTRGFTLTELLIVVAIIILLVAVSVPSFLSASRAGRLGAGVRSVQASLMAARNLATAYNAVYSVEFGELRVGGNVGAYDLRIFDDGTSEGSNWLTNSSRGWKPEEQGYFVTVQYEPPEQSDASGHHGDVIARDPVILPKGVVFAFNATATNATWTAIGPIPGNAQKDTWDNTGTAWRDDNCPDIAFLGDGSCADNEGQSTIVLYDASEEADADGTVSAAVITVVKYTGEIVIGTVRARRANLQ
jgi:prepilin-type N-terminal cleavage/methylation domain-containing protein